ncbi:hypothetical protein SAMN05660976_00928 [Nonomuraea pusilla]|uniref:Nitroreductase family protein n=1 Tax=Nonomuraea pusilla TaxID=46177 RepID=A0A1H7IU22_9ACTN|nr:hypothetical protein SAMN05660976_00928 [Nonomuraea pusilla]
MIRRHVGAFARVATRAVAWVSAERAGVAPTTPTLGDRRASGHSIIGLAVFDRSALRAEAMWALGVPEDRIYIDRGFSGATRRNRAGLDQAPAAVWDDGAARGRKADERTAFSGPKPLSPHPEVAGGSSPTIPEDPRRSPDDRPPHPGNDVKPFTTPAGVGRVIRAAVAAPSVHNTQPWRFRRVDDETLEFYADLDRLLPVVDPMGRGLGISCGAALFNMRLAIRVSGHTPNVTAMPAPGDAPDLLAVVRATEGLPATPEENRLYAVIPHRRTNRFPFEARPLPPEVILDLVTAAHAEGATLVLLDRMAARRVLDMVAAADRMVTGEAGYHAELARWTATAPGHSGTPASDHDTAPAHAGAPTPDHGPAPAHAGMTVHAGTAGRGGIADGPGIVRDRDIGQELGIAGGAGGPRCDGVPWYAFGPRPRGGALPLRDFAPGAPGREVADFEDDPLVGVLLTQGDGPRDWLAAGQALQRVLLSATVHGVSASLFSQPLDLHDGAHAGVTAGRLGHVQMILRLGYGPLVPPTPRRPVPEVLELR